MKAREWIVRATQDMPVGVMTRVEADTLGHLYDAGLADLADVRPVLGEPEATADELRRLYLTRREWLGLRPAEPLLLGLGLSEWLCVLFWPVVLLWSVLDARVTPLHGFWLSQCLLAVWGMATLLLTQQLHPLRRSQWRQWALMVGGLTLQWPYFDEVLLGGRGWLGLGVLGLFVIHSARTLVRQDGRLRRTLALERVAPDSQPA